MGLITKEEQATLVIDGLKQIVTLCNECMGEIQSSGINYRVMDILAEDIPEISDGLFSQVCECLNLQSHLNNSQQETSSKTNKMHEGIQKSAEPLDIQNFCKRYPLHSNNHTLIRHIVLSKWRASRKMTSGSKP